MPVNLPSQSLFPSSCSSSSLFHAPTCWLLVSHTCFLTWLLDPFSCLTYTLCPYFPLPIFLTVSSPSPQPPCSKLLHLLPQVHLLYPPYSNQSASSSALPGPSGGVIESAEETAFLLSQLKWQDPAGHTTVQSCNCRESPAPASGWGLLSLDNLWRFQLLKSKLLLSTEL